MVAADWRRTILAPGAVPCLRSQLLKQLGKVTFVSFRRVIFAPVATNAEAFLMLVDVKTNTGKVRVAIEFVAIAHGRTELTIVSIVNERRAEGRCAGRRTDRAGTRRARDLGS